MTTSRLNQFNAGTTLTETKLEGEFDNIYDTQGTTFGTPRTAAFDLNAQKLVLDAGGNSSFTADTEDVLDLELQGVDLYQWDGDATSPVNGIVYRATATGSDTLILAGTNTGSDSNTGIDIQAAGTGSIKVDSEVVITGGQHTIWVPAAAMTPDSAAGCSAYTTTGLVGGEPNLNTLDFSDGGDKYAQFNIAFPKSWDLNSTGITYQVFWTVSSAVSTLVAWELSAVAVHDNGSIAAAFGTPIYVGDTAHNASNDLHVTDVSSALTIATPDSIADDDTVFFYFGRDTDDTGGAGDTMTQDARLIGIKLFYTVDAKNDA